LMSLFQLLTMTGVYRVRGVKLLCFVPLSTIFQSYRLVSTIKLIYLSKQKIYYEIRKWNKNERQKKKYHTFGTKKSKIHSDNRRNRKNRQP